MFLSKRIYTRASASLICSGIALDPLQVTVALRLPPDAQFRKDEPRLVRRRSGKIEELPAHQFGHWSISSEKWVDSPQLHIHLAWLLEQLEPKLAAINDLKSLGSDFKFFCFSVGATQSPPSLPRTIRSRAKQLGIEIVIDHYDSSTDPIESNS